MQQNTTEIFRDAPVPKAVLSNVIPSIISMIMVLIYNLADTFFIGQTKNALMVAAVSVATPAFLLFMAVGMLFGIGGTSFISRMLGEGQEERAKHASAFCFWTGLAVGIISMILIVIFAEPVCKAIGASPDTIEYATQYLRIVAIGIPFLIISNAFSNIIRSEGRAKTAMSGMIIGNMANVILDPSSEIFYPRSFMYRIFCQKNHSYRFDYRITKPETKLRVPYLPLVSRHH